jgi:hypothetical protein
MVAILLPADGDVCILSPQPHSGIETEVLRPPIHRVAVPPRFNLVWSSSCFAHAEVRARKAQVCLRIEYFMAPVHSCANGVKLGGHILRPLLTGE